MENHKTESKSTFNTIDLRVAYQQDLSKTLELPCVLISFDNNINADKQRILELFAFAENHQINDLLEKLNTTYPTFKT